MADTDARVVIVGGGPVGLMLACELGMRSVPTILLAEAEGISVHPKANTHGARAMEAYRRHGVSTKLRESGLSKSYSTDVAYHTRLLEHELHRVALPSPAEALAHARAAVPLQPTRA